MKKLIILAALVFPSACFAQTSVTGLLDAQSFKTIVVSTASCSNSVILLLSTNTARVGNLITNESTTVTVRIGPSTILPAVGHGLLPGTSMTYDKPRYYKGSIWCVSDGAAVKISVTEGTP